jgi:hypothetical protein
MESRNSTMDAITFQRRHFQMIAEVLNDSFPVPENNTDPVLYWRLIVDAFASRLASTNPNFDRARFLAACGME